MTKIHPKHYPYLIVLAVIALNLIYAIIPKPEPINSVSIIDLSVLNSTKDTALIKISLEWDCQIQPTYLAVDIQPKNAPANISHEEWGTYHLIRQPQNWINVKTTYEKKGTLDYYALAELNNNTEFKLKVKCANEEKDLAFDEQAFSIPPKKVIR